MPEPYQLGPIYAQNFLNYINQNPSMKIICFGLNCSAPEDLIQSLRCMFKNQEFENELIRRKIGFVVYANLNDRRKVHSQGFDRSKDNAQVSNNPCFFHFRNSKFYGPNHLVLLI